MTTRSRKGKREVAWGYFMDGKDGKRVLEAEATEYRANFWRDAYQRWGHNPGPIFRITKPKEPQP
jgi:hypothetical protein